MINTAKLTTHNSEIYQLGWNIIKWTNFILEWNHKKVASRQMVCEEEIHQYMELPSLSTNIDDFTQSSSTTTLTLLLNSSEDG